MLRLDKDGKTLHRLKPKKLSDAGFLERHHVQQMIRNNADDFFAELGEKLLLLGEEVRPAEFVDDRIDLLALDPEGAAVIIELKRGTNKLQLLQALGYAGMIAKWSPEKFAEQYAQSVKGAADPREEFEEFLGEGISTVNQSQRSSVLLGRAHANCGERSRQRDLQRRGTCRARGPRWMGAGCPASLFCLRQPRGLSKELPVSARMVPRAIIILLAEDFDFEVLVTAEWLTEKYELDVRCYRLALSTEAERDFLTCTCIYPPPEITEHAIRRKHGGLPEPLPWSDWETALAETENPAVADFFRSELAAGRENNLRYRRIQWRFDGKRRFRAMARRKYAVVKQYGRFTDDTKF